MAHCFWDRTTVDRDEPKVDPEQNKCSPVQPRAVQQRKKATLFKGANHSIRDELTMNGIDLNAIEKRRLAWLLFRHPALACFIRDFRRGTSKFAVLQECSAVELL